MFFFGHDCFCFAGLCGAGLDQPDWTIFGLQKVDQRCENGTGWLFTRRFLAHSTCKFLSDRARERLWQMLIYLPSDLGQRRKQERWPEIEDVHVSQRHPIHLHTVRSHSIRIGKNDSSSLTMTSFASSARGTALSRR